MKDVLSYLNEHALLYLYMKHVADAGVWLAGNALHNGLCETVTSQCQDE